MLFKKGIVCACIFLLLLTAAALMNIQLREHRVQDPAAQAARDGYRIHAYERSFRPREYVRIVRDAVDAP